MQNAIRPEHTETTPFLKWAGGKQWLLPVLKPLLLGGSRKRKYIEPFLGGAAVFLAAKPANARLSDSNKELIDCYRAIKHDVESVIKTLRGLSFTTDCYYRVRSSRPRSLVKKAARFIYLNRTCWNGLYRVNRNGDFNVPIGSFDSDPDFVVADRLSALSKLLRDVKLYCTDFEKACTVAERGDTVYLDPPYMVAHKSNGFLRYNERVFSWEDQIRLAKLARELRNRKCRLMISNADHPSIIALYKGFIIRRLKRKSLVAGIASKRRLVTELLITNIKH